MAFDVSDHPTSRFLQELWIHGSKVLGLRELRIQNHAILRLGESPKNAAAGSFDPKKAMDSIDCLQSVLVDCWFFAAAFCGSMRDPATRNRSRDSLNLKVSHSAELDKPLIRRQEHSIGRRPSTIRRVSEAIKISRLA